MVNLEDPVIKAKIEEAKKLIEDQILEYFKFNTTITTESDGSQSVLVSYELPKDSKIFKVIEGFFLAMRIPIDKTILQEIEMLKHYEKTGERIQYRSDVK